MATPNEVIVEHYNLSAATSHFFKRTARWNGIRLRHTLSRGGEMPEHYNQEHEIAIPLSGSFFSEAISATGRHRMGERTVGHTVIIPSGAPYAVSWDDGLENLSLYLDPAFLARLAAETFKSDRIEIIEACTASDPLIRQIGLALMGEMESEAPAGQLYAESLAQTLAIHLLRHYSTIGDQFRPFSGGLARHKLRRVTEFITENLDAELSLTELAQVAELSPFHFARAFKQTTGLTPHQYLLKSRVGRAKELLTATDLPIVEISYRAGFKTQSHFTTLFRRLTGVTPGTYRHAVLR
jgi:AraC family transcriptional regulator